jgi:hypothetical protein
MPHALEFISRCALFSCDGDTAHPGMRSLLLWLCLILPAFSQVPTPTPIPNSAPRIFIDGEADALNSGAFLFCSTADDGLPRTLTFNWTRVSGPGSVSWTAQQRSMTHARFSIKGLYVIQCAVSDGQYTVTDRITIMADAAADIAVRP